MSVTFQGDTDEAWGDGPAAYEPGESPRSAGDRTPPQDNAAEQSVLGSMLLSKDAIADVVEALKGVDYYRPAHEIIHDAIIDLYGRGEPADPITVAAELQQARRAPAHRRRALPPHPVGQRADRGQRRLLRRDRARQGDPAPPGRGRHPHRRPRLRRRGPDRRRRRQRAGRGLPGHRPPRERGLRAAERHHERRPRRDRDDRQPRGRPLRRADRLRRPRRPDQRPPLRPDDHRRGSSRDGEVDAGPRLLPRRVDPQQPHQLLLQPRDDALGDHDAPALGRGEGAAQPHPQRHDARRRLGEARPQDGPGLRVRRCSSTTAPT